MTWYNTGTVAVTNASATVTGTGTAWIANGQASMGFRGPDRMLYEILSVSADTTLTLATPYQGSTASAQPYSLMPTQDYIRSLAGQVASLIANYSAVYNNFIAGKFSAGTASSPGVTNGANTTTGLYWPATNQVALSTNGVAGLVVDGSQNVGIGTTTPTSLLHVHGGNARLRSTSDGSNGLLQFLDQNNVLRASLYAAGTSYFAVETSGAVPIILTNNTCIGTTTPAAKLTVAQSAANSDTAVLQMTSTAGPNYGLMVSSSATAVNTQALIRGCVANSTLVFQVAGSGNVTNTNNSYGAISDAKLKENITPAAPVLHRLMQVLIRKYNLIGDPDHKHLGVIAQELELVFPGLVESTPDYIETPATRVVDVPATLGVDGATISPATTRSEGYTERTPTGTVTKSVKYSVFVPMLIQAMQEQQGQIEVLLLAGASQQRALEKLELRLSALGG